MNYRSLFAVVLLAACQAAPSVPDASYTVRGVVRSVPDPDRPGDQLVVAHEAVPDFKDKKGRPVGMAAMSMPFPAAPELLEGIQPGDVIEFTFEVQWQGSPPYRVVALSELPADTDLVGVPDFKR